MLGINRATQAVSESAESVKGLADSAKAALSETSSLVRTTTQYAPYLIVGIGVIAGVALILSIVAVSRRG